jgi:hypothetical protein
MYLEETIINGILCYRHTPDGIYQAYSPEKLIRRADELFKENHELSRALESAISVSQNTEFTPAMQRVLDRVRGKA